jgi:hypothetical protein
MATYCLSENVLTDVKGISYAAYLFLEFIAVTAYTPIWRLATAMT